MLQKISTMLSFPDWPWMLVLPRGLSLICFAKELIVSASGRKDA